MWDTFFVQRALVQYSVFLCVFRNRREMSMFTKYLKKSFEWNQGAAEEITLDVRVIYFVRHAFGKLKIFFIKYSS